MRFAGISVAALIILMLAGTAPARADSVEYQVTIYASWDQASFFALYGENGTNVLDQFYATYDMYSNGTVIPGTMSFNIVDSGGPLQGATPFTYGVVPSFCNDGSQPGPTGEGCVAVGNPEPGVDYPGGNTAWYDSEGYMIEATATPGQLGTTTGAVATIDCVYNACAIASCWDIVCTQGGNNPSSGGYITETLLTPTATPEPSTFLLLLCGVPLLFVCRRSIHSHLIS